MDECKACKVGLKAIRSRKVSFRVFHFSGILVFILLGLNAGCRGPENRQTLPPQTAIATPNPALTPPPFTLAEEVAIATRRPDLTATQTAEAASIFAAIAATLAAQPTQTPILGATAIVQEMRLATAIAATLTAQPTSTPDQAATEIAMAVQPTDVIAATLTALTIATPDISATQTADVVVTVSALNVRTGPDVSYDIITVVNQNDQLEVIGQAYRCGWLKIITPNGREGWVSGAFRYVTLNRPCGQIPQATIPPTPTSCPTQTPDQTAIKETIVD